jgi:dGTPase
VPYAEVDRERWVAEPPKRHARTPFERDRARVLHSASLRRLAAKTQVVEPGRSAALSELHAPRTRLTHSLECAQIGRELGRGFGCDPDIVEAACLAHDLGHPPFGHTGESVLNQIAAGCGGFEGNAQSLRLLTRLEPKSFAPDDPPTGSGGPSEPGRSVGLNLTRATLDAVLKYPWYRPAEAVPAARTPFGVYSDDAEVFDWVRAGAPDRRRGFEAQVMDWSDDVAYSVHDLEDGINAGHIELRSLADPEERRAVCVLTAKAYCDAEVAELEEVFAHLLAEPFWPPRCDGGPRALAALKNLTSELIGRFCRAAEAATRERYGAGPLTRHGADLVLPRERRLECALLKGTAACYIFARADLEATRAWQREVIAHLVAAIADGAPETLEALHRPGFTAATSDAARLRVVIDQVASLTDASALGWHRDLCGCGP